MATYGQRDKFLQALVTFTTSEQAKQMASSERQELLIKIRDKYAPDITNAEWGEMAQGINGFKSIIIDSVKYGEVPVVDSQLPNDSLNKDDDEIIDDSKTVSNDDNLDDDDDDGATEDDDFDETKSESESKPEPEPPETFGRFTKPKETKPTKVNTSKLRGLLKPKKTDE